MFSTRTLSISIACAPDAVYEFIRDPRNLPRWAPAFCKAVAPAGDAWTVETPEGPVGLRFVERNAFGVLDHYVRLASGLEIYVPMRVVRNDDGSEVLLTVFRTLAMSDQRFEEDAGFVQQDLNTLKTVLEA